jgi:taurine transport system permease protein
VTPSAETITLALGRPIAPLEFLAAAAGLLLGLQALRRLGPGALPVVRGGTTLLAFLMAWEGAVAAGLVTSIMLPPPSLTLQRLHGLWLNGHLQWHVLASLRRFLVSFALAVGAGVVLGVVLAAFPRPFRPVYPVLDFLRVIPAPAWLPFAILWLGLGEPPAIFIVTLGVFFPVLLNTIRGMQDALPLHLEVIRTLGGTRRQEILLAALPAALPAVLTGVRVGFGVGWIVLAAAELAGTDNGLGWLVSISQWVVDVPTVIAAMTLICWLGLGLDLALRRLERWLLPW